MHLALEVAAPTNMDFGPLELEDLALAGDDNAWTLEDWRWDGKSFTAAPATGSSRLGKRHCSGLHFALPGSTEHAGEGNLESQLSCCGTPMDKSAHSGNTKNPEDLAGCTSSEGARAGGPPVCQVESCGRDLSGLTTYYQRCRICEVHIKEPQFMRAGLIQRFCQQCGRCHELAAFQGSKRSCREQLAKHNARRRRRSDRKADLASFSAQQPEQAVQRTPCQSRLADAFSSLEPLMTHLQPGSAPATAPHGSPAFVGIPTQRSGYGMAAFPAASIPQTETMEVIRIDGSGRVVSQDKSVAVGIPMVPLNSQENLNQGTQGGESGSSFDAAMAMMGGGSGTVHTTSYQPENLVVRLSVKLFNCTPAELPKDLKRQLTGWLQSTPAGAEGYLRPGCVHLTVQAHVPHHSSDQISKGGVAAVAAYLINQQHPVWSNHVVLLDLNGQFALMKGGQLLSTWQSKPQPPSSSEPGSCSDVRCKAVDRLLPQLEGLYPAAIFPEKQNPARVRLSGRGIACGDCKVLCRSGGRYLNVTCEHYGACCQPGEEHTKVALQELDVILPGDLQPGLVWLEIQKGCLLSSALPMLVAPCQPLAKELCQLSKSGFDCKGVVTDIGLLFGDPSSAASLQTAIRSSPSLMFATQFGHQSASLPCAAPEARHV